MDTLLIDQTYEGEKKVKNIEDPTVNSSFEAPVFGSVSTLTNLSEESQYGELSNFFTNIFLCREEDKLIWKPSPTGAFSVKSFCKAVEGRPRSRASCALAWVGMVPPLVEAFYWLAVAGRVSMADMLRRRGIMAEGILDMCYVQVCGGDGRPPFHLLQDSFVHLEPPSPSMWYFVVLSIVIGGAC